MTWAVAKTFLASAVWTTTPIIIRLDTQRKFYHRGRTLRKGAICTKSPRTGTIMLGRKRDADINMILQRTSWLLFIRG